MRKRKKSHGRYAKYAEGCRCSRCIFSMRREVKKRFVKKSKRKTLQMEIDRRIRISLCYMRRKDRNKQVEIREVYLKEIHPNYLEGKRTLAAGGC